MNSWIFMNNSWIHDFLLYLSSQDFMATGNIPRHIVLTGLPGENDIGLRRLATVPTNAVPQPT